MITVGPRILNNKLKWDGSHLGSYIRAITHEWTLEGIRYYGITLPIGWSGDLPSGIIYCIAIRAKNSFPYIVEEIKEVFGLPRCGLHGINIDRREYIIYYVPISTSGKPVWETPLSRLDSRHVLRKDQYFRREVQKIIAFCDILSLYGTGEPSIRIRPGSNNTYVPISINESTTTLLKANEYDYSILSKTLFLKWFGEETCMSDVVKELVNYHPEWMTSERSLAVICSEIRSKVDEIIKRYDVSYLWYSNFIVDRMSRHLLSL